MRGELIIHILSMVGICVGLTSASGQENADVDPTAKEAFDIVVSRNIFDPNRAARTRSSEKIEQATQVEAVPEVIRERIVLNGVMVDETRAYGFFDGTDSEYRKVVAIGSEIGGLKLVGVESTGVTLASGTNVMTVRVSDELEREGDAPWIVRRMDGRSSFASGGRPTEPDSPAAAGDSDSESGVEETGISDVLKRLLEKRRKEAEE